MSRERASDLRRLGDLNPGWAVNPNRISSSGRDRSGQSHLDQRPSAVLLERPGTAVNCNPVQGHVGDRFLIRTIPATVKAYDLPPNGAGRV
ncbi:hypothetical protein GCM10009525_51460 [Streptosporangium amethystogenes subsp. fukuiense]